MLSNFKPMLSGKIRDMNNIIFPTLASPKLDGIRCIIHPELGPVTRKLKAVPNKHTFKVLNQPELFGLDGELVAGSPTHLNAMQMTSSAVMSYEGKPELTYFVFDRIIDSQGNKLTSYKARYEHVQEFFSGCPTYDTVQIIPVTHEIINNLVELKAYEHRTVAEGFEGVMLNKPNMPYKHGRSADTKTQQHLLKLKRFEDAEGRIIAFHELMHNDNPATIDKLGYTERSSSKEHLIPGNTLGKITVEILNGEFEGKTVKIGSGFNDTQRANIWNNLEDYYNRVVTFKYQAHGSKDKPRIPIFKAFRED